MTSLDYRKAADEFRLAVGAQPLKGVLRSAALACEEARAALMRAGTGDEPLHRQLLETQRRLEMESR